jgi:hypothetical protein
MAAAEVQIQMATGAGGTLASAEGGIVFNRSDNNLTTSPIPIPTSTGTNFSYPKFLCTSVTVAGTTTISNRKIWSDGAATTGLALFYKASASYTQATAVADSDSGSNGATPSGYSALPSASGSAATWDAGGVATSSTGKNGNYVVLALGVSNNYAGGAGTGISLPALKFQYDEA